VCGASPEWDGEPKTPANVPVYPPAGRRARKEVLLTDLPRNPLGGRTRVAVAVIVEDGQLLIAHRFPHVHLPDLWEFPGGKIHPGEDPAACAVREVEEELGIRIEIQGLLLRRPYDYADRRVDLWFFAARRLSGEPRAIGCTEWRWVVPEELPAYPLPDASEPVLDALRRGGWLPGEPPRQEEREAILISTRPLAPAVTEIVLRPQDPGGEIFRAGQYWILSPDPEVSAAFSVASPPTLPSELSFCVKVGGEDGAALRLSRLAPGARVGYAGPFGDFTLRENSVRDPVFVAMGTGIAPLRSMILTLLSRETARRIDLVLGARAPEDLLYGTEFRRLAELDGRFHFHPCLTRPPATGWDGWMGRITDQLPSIFADLRGREAYLCGKARMVVDAIDALVDLGIDRALCYREAWG
jgi:mutator protein MutT